MMGVSYNPGVVKCEVLPNSTETIPESCGSDLAFPYFISFYVLCSFLVSTMILVSQS